MSHDRRLSTGDIAPSVRPPTCTKLVRRRRPAALVCHRKNLSLADVDLLKTARPPSARFDLLSLRRSSDSAIESNPYAQGPVEIIPGFGLWIGHEGHVRSWAETVGRCTIVNVAQELDDVFAEAQDDRPCPREYQDGQIVYMHAKWSHGEERIACTRSDEDAEPRLDDMVRAMEQGRRAGRQTLMQ